jgi:anti-sigma factor RsiW
VTELEPLTCQELVELVTDYLEGTLPPDLRARFEAHLALCPGCVTYVEQMRETVRLVGRLRAEDVPPEMESALLEAFRDWRRR